MLARPKPTLRYLSDSAGQRHQCANDEPRDPDAVDATMRVLGLCRVFPYPGNESDRHGLFQGSRVGSVDALLDQAHAVVDHSDHAVADAS